MRHVKQVGTFLGLGTLILSLAACGSGEKRREACLSPALEKNIYGFNPCNPFHSSFQSVSVVSSCVEGSRRFHETGERPWNTFSTTITTRTLRGL